MQYRIVFLAALSATGALALPALPRDNHMQEPSAPAGGFTDIDFNKYECREQSNDAQGVRVQLGTGPDEAIQRELQKVNDKFTLCFDEPQDFSDISITLSMGAPETLRCAVADENGQMVGGTRKDNADFTFASGDPWSFIIPTNKAETVNVTKVVCDPEFTKITDDQRKVEEAVNVLLREKKGQDPSQAKVIGEFPGPFFGTNAVGEKQLPVQSGKKYETLEVQVGRLTNIQPDPFTNNQLLRCAALQADGKKIFATRGQNLDDTFSDNNAGEWTFTDPNGNPKPTRHIKAIACSKDFVQNNRNQVAAQ